MSAEKEKADADGTSQDKEEDSEEEAAGQDAPLYHTHFPALAKIFMEAAAAE